MQITIINDCRDQNAKLRQITRIGSIFKNCSVNCFGVESELEAAGFLVDALDAFEGRKGVVILNFARREKRKEKWENGSPFGFFDYGETLVVSSVEGLVLSLAKKLGVLKKFYIMKIPEVLDRVKSESLDEKTKQRIANSQFRSFDFLPRAAHWLASGEKLPCDKYDLSKITNAPNAVWHIDNFGNIKTTLLENELSLEKGEIEIKINGKENKLKFYRKLADLPDNSAGLVSGSSGIADKRFLEIILQGGNAAQKLGLKIGDLVKLK